MIEVVFVLVIFVGLIFGFPFYVIHREKNGKPLSKGSADPFAFCPPEVVARFETDRKLREIENRLSELEKK